MVSTIYSKNKARIATASSLESYLGNKTGVATESLDDKKFNEEAAFEKDAYIHKVVVDLLEDGKIFFSDKPEEAYADLIDQLLRPEMRNTVLFELKRANNADPVENYNAMSQRLFDMTMETKERRKALDEIKAKLIAEDPSLESLL